MKLKATGFRGRTLDIELPRIAVLSGPNGSGKTNVLNAIEFALTGNCASLGSSPTAMMPFCEDGATASFGEHAHRLKCRDKTAISEPIGEAEAIPLPPIFANFNAFVRGSDKDRAAQMNALIQFSEPEAQKAAKDAAQKSINADGIKYNVLSLDALEGEIKFAAETHKRNKATMEQLLIRTMDAGENAEELALELSDLQQQIATFESMDRDSKVVAATRKRLEAELAHYADWSLEAEAAARAEEQPGPRPTVPDRPARMPELTIKGSELHEQIKAMKDGICPYLGRSCPDVLEKVEQLQDQHEGMRLEYIRLKDEYAALMATHQTRLDAWSNDSIAWSDAQERLKKWGEHPAETIQAIKAQLAELTAAPPDYAAMQALERARDGLTLRLEKARQRTAHLAALENLSVAEWETRARCLRKARKAWDTGYQTVLAGVVEPLEAKLSELSQVKVELNPGDNWRITCGGRALAALSGGQKIHFWCILMAVIARHDDVLLAEIAEADAEILEDLPTMLEGCKARQIVLATWADVPGAIGPDVYGGTL